MSRTHLVVLFSIFALLACLVAIDIYQVHCEIERNRNALDRLTSEQVAVKKLMRDLEDRISRIKNDDRAVETMALKKYRMLRSDQYILHDATD